MPTMILKESFRRLGFWDKALAAHNKLIAAKWQAYLKRHLGVHEIKRRASKPRNRKHLYASAPQR